MEYLTFCGIKLRDDFSEIIKKFRDRGFDITSQKDNKEVSMNGILYDEKCEVNMSYSIEYNGFHSIGIHFTRVYHSWDLLSGKFYQIKDEMEKHYGTPPPVLLNSFSRKFKSGNNNEMKYLDDACFIATFYLPLFYADIVICKDATINIRIHDNIYDEAMLKKRHDLITEVYK